MLSSLGFRLFLGLQTLMSSIQNSEHALVGPWAKEHVQLHLPPQRHGLQMGRGFGFSSIKAASPQREQVVASASLEWLEKTQRAQYPLIKEYGLNEKGLHKPYSLIKGYWALWGPASVLRFGFRAVGFSGVWSLGLEVFSGFCLFFFFCRVWEFGGLAGVFLPHQWRSR